MPRTIRDGGDDADDYWAKIAKSADVQKLFDLTATKATAVLALAVFLLPMVDDIIEHRWPPKAN